MIDYHGNLVDALDTILPTHYEMRLHGGLATPCISYMEIDNRVEVNGDTLGYSHLAYQVKVWGNNIDELQSYAKQIDDILRPLGWTRTGSNELYDMNSTMIQKIMRYEALGLENFI